MAHELAVDPRNLVIVSVDDRVAGGYDLVAVSCRFVPVDAADSRRIAIEVVRDPAHLQPTAPYYCPLHFRHTL